MIRELKTLIAVSEEGTFAGAGHRIGLTQAAVSAQMQRLEEQLGHALFDRAGRNARLNPQGLDALVQAREVVRLFEEMAAQRRSRPLGGRVVLGAIASAQAIVLPGVLARFRARHPGVHVRVVPGVSFQLLHQVDAGEVDAAIMIRPVFDLQADLHWTTLSHEPFRLVVPAGLPSQLLARRPDIVAAEYRVLAAYNLVGQARLAQLPSISLTARGGTASFALSDLMKSFTFGFMPSINLPMLDPNVRARVKTTEANVGVVENEYGCTVMTAFEEVESALVNVDAHKKQRIELQQQVDQLRVVGSQIAAQAREGIASQLDVFESERSLLTAEQSLLAVHQQILADTVTLYKALGGGWPDTTVRNGGTDTTADATPASSVDNRKAAR